MICYTVTDNWNINFFIFCEKKIINKNTASLLPLDLLLHVTCERQAITVVKTTDFGARLSGFEFLQVIYSLYKFVPSSVKGRQQVPRPLRLRKAI